MISNVFPEKYLEALRHTTELIIIKLFESTYKMQKIVRDKRLLACGGFNANIFYKIISDLKRNYPAN